MCIHVPVWEIKICRSFEIFPIYWIELMQVVAILCISCWPFRNNLLVGQYSFWLLSEKNMCREADLSPQGHIVIWWRVAKCVEVLLVPGQPWAMVMSMQTLSCRWEKQLRSSLEEDSWNNRCYCPNHCPWGRPWQKEKKGRFPEWEINIASIIWVQK